MSGRERSWVAGARGWVIAAGLLLTIGASPRAHAQVEAELGPDPGIGRDALPQLIDVGALPTPAPGHAALAAGLGYGVAESVLGEDESHQRTGLRLAAGYAVLRWLSVAARFDTRYDWQSGGADDGDDGVLGSTRLLARGGAELAPRAWLGGELALRAPPAADITLGFATLGFDARALGSYVLSTQTTLAASLGFRLDNSDQAVDGLDRLSGADRVALSASSANAVLLGFGAVHALGKLRLLAELGWDVLVGATAPSIGRSPLRLEVGARYALARDLQLELTAAVSPSARPGFGPDDPPLPIDPRFALGAGIAYAFYAGALPGTATATSNVHGRVVGVDGEPIAGADLQIGSRVVQSGPDGAFALRGVARGEQQLAASADGYVARRVALRLTSPRTELGDLLLVSNFGALRGRVLDANGVVVPGARVSIASAGRDVTCDQNGSFALDRLPPGTLELYVQAAQWEPITVPVLVMPGRELQVDLVLREQLPVGQIRGTVRGPHGEPVMAEVLVEELSVRESTGDDGTFTLDVQPGHYTVTVSAVGFDRDRREVDVEHNGVTVLLIDLRAAQ
jgi:hypothetical protein